MPLNALVAAIDAAVPRVAPRAVLPAGSGAPWGVVGFVFGSGLEAAASSNRKFGAEYSSASANRMSMLRGKRRVLALLEAEVAASGQVGLCSVGSGSGKLEARFNALTGLPVVCVDIAPEHDQFADDRRVLEQVTYVQAPAGRVIPLPARHCLMFCYPTLGAAANLSYTLALESPAVRRELVVLQGSRGRECRSHRRRHL